MTQVHDNAPRISPWLSVWLEPSATIERVVASNPRRYVLLLAVLASMATVLLQLFDVGLTTNVFDWRIIGGAAVFGIVVGIASLYISALVNTWIGRLLGGNASPVQMRAVIAWGLAPIAASLLIYFVILVGLRLFGGDDAAGSISRTLISALFVIGNVLGLWSLIMMMFMLARVQGFGFGRTIANFALSFLLVLATVVIFKTFFFQPFSIPSGHMKPTLLVGDQFFVSKFSYGYTRYSLPFSLSLFSGRVFAVEPQRGDVAVFRLPEDDSTDHVNRIVGLPGDRIQIVQGVLNINGVPVKRERMEDFVGEAPCPTTSINRVKRWRETLPNGVSYETLDCTKDSEVPGSSTVYTVPPGSYFMLGDNIDNATDSRSQFFGFIPFDYLIGKAQMIILSIKRDDPTIPPTARIERIGKIVR